MKTKKKFLVSCIVVMTLVVYSALNNINVLVNIIEFSDSPSIFGDFAIKQIYRQDKDKIRSKIIDDLINRENVNRYNSYIRIASVIGVENVGVELVKLYIECKDEENCSSTVYYAITGLGLIGDYKYVPILEKILENYDSINVPVSKYVIARSLYLVTGERYNDSSDMGDYNKILISNELKEIRSVIERSAGRTRMYDEMLIIDKIFQPPN